MNGGVGGWGGSVRSGKGGSSSIRGSSKQNSPSPNSSLSTSSLERVIRHPELRSHSLELYTFQRLSVCHICHNFLWGLSHQGLLCHHCGLICHDGCVAKVSPDCAPNLSQLESVFGVSLTILVKSTAGGKVPFVLQKCFGEIEKRGMGIEGIYRIPATKEAIERLKTILERDRDNTDLSTTTDIHSMCSIVKMFLRRLPEPLISETVFQTFLQKSSNASTKGGWGITVEDIRQEFKHLPPAHYITLKALLQHLHRVAENSERNKMNPFNLSSVFAPSVLGPAQISIQTLQTGTLLLELMITQFRNLFPKETI